MRAYLIYEQSVLQITETMVNKLTLMSHWETFINDLMSFISMDTCSVTENMK